MCTVSWATQKGGYRLFFNRDEQNSRSVAEAPRKWKTAAGVFLGPLDPDGKGTWIGVNPDGWTFALLNFYDRAHVHPSGTRSRGTIISSIGALSDLRAIRDWFKKQTLADFAPFHLLVVDSVGSGVLFTWNGDTLAEAAEAEKSLPISTSSIDTDRVLARRKAVFEGLHAGGPTAPEVLVAFHRHYDQSDGAASVCMRRADAQTVSLSEVSVGKRETLFRYFPRDEASGGFLSPVECRLKRA